MKILIALLFIPTLAYAEIEYTIPKDEPIIISYTNLMDGEVKETEKYKTLKRDKVSTTLEQAVKDGKCTKRVLGTITQKKEKIIGSGVKVLSGSLPSDYNYDSVKEREKLIQAEITKKKLADEEIVRAEAIAIVDGVSIAEK